MFQDLHSTKTSTLQLLRGLEMMSLLVREEEHNDGRPIDNRQTMNASVYLLLELSPDYRISARLIGSLSSIGVLRDARGLLSRQAKRPSTLYLSDAFVVRDDFGVPDGLEEFRMERGPTVCHQSMTRRTSYKSSRRRQFTGAQLDVWTIQNEFVYQRISETGMRLIDFGLSSQFDDLAATLRDLLLDTESEEEQPAGSLYVQSPFVSCHVSII